MSNLKFAKIKTPTPGSEWVNQADDERLVMVQKVVDESALSFREIIEAVSTKDDGQVIIRLRESISAAERGGALLDLEETLKNEIDEGITVWLEALGDKNSLRKLRGIEVKA